jgi:hypothetical protein
MTDNQDHDPFQELETAVTQHEFHVSMLAIYPDFDLETPGTDFDQVLANHPDKFGDRIHALVGHLRTTTRAFHAVLRDEVLPVYQQVEAGELAGGAKIHARLKLTDPYLAVRSDVLSLLKEIVEERDAFYGFEGLACVLISESFRCELTSVRTIEALWSSSC